LRKCNVKQYDILHKECTELVCNNSEVWYFFSAMSDGEEWVWLSDSVFFLICSLSKFWDKSFGCQGTVCLQP